MNDQQAVDFLNDFINENYDLVRDWVMHEEAHYNQLKNANVDVEHPTIPFEEFSEQWEAS